MQQNGQRLRKIVHVDMDAFYAAVEQRDNPALRNRPLIVGGDPRSRGVVCTCSYEARRYGIHSAMASSLAVKLCPQAIFMKPNFDKYSRISAQIRSIFKDYTDLVEPLSLDEAYLDVTQNKKNIPFAARIAAEIRARIKDDTGLTASAGVSYNKFLAKVASEYNKPDGLKVITPEQAAAFLDELPIGDFYGVGRVTEKKMKALGINCGKDLKRLTREELQDQFGKSGTYLYLVVRGIDNRPVVTNWIRKSIGKERTFARDIADIEKMQTIIKDIAAEVSSILKRKKRKGKTITLKVRYSDLTRSTRSQTIETETDEHNLIYQIASDLLQKTEVFRRSVRLLGVAVSGLD